jgi:hypothetical protein
MYKRYFYFIVDAKENVIEKFKYEVSAISRLPYYKKLYCDNRLKIVKKPYFSQRDEEQ